MLVDEWLQKDLVCKTVANKLYAINNNRMSNEIKNKITVVNFLTVTTYNIAYPSEQCDLNTKLMNRFDIDFYFWTYFASFTLFRRSNFV